MTYRDFKGSSLTKALHSLSTLMGSCEGGIQRPHLENAKQMNIFTTQRWRIPMYDEKV